MMRTFIIAEAGVNHNGSIDIAKELINQAKSSGADAVKFQTFKAKELVSKFASKAEYQKKTTGSDESQLKMIEKLELTEENHLELYEYCHKTGIEFLSSPFDLESISYLNQLGLDTFKIPSGEINNLPYLREIGRLKKKIIMSTGMANLGEIEVALNTLQIAGTLLNDIIVLHCNTEYPTPFEDVNLTAMLTIRNAFKVKIGYSDHTLGIEIPIAAVAMGATVIEKHFTLDCSMKGSDHKSSIEPSEFKKMVTSIRNLEKSFGDGIKKPTKSEIINKPIARKSIVAKKKIKIGEKFSKQNITVKRPGTGISPMLWDEVLGKTAIKDFETDELIII